MKVVKEFELEEVKVQVCQLPAGKYRVRMSTARWCNSDGNVFTVLRDPDLRIIMRFNTINDAIEEVQRQERMRKYRYLGKSFFIKA